MVDGGGSRRRLRHYDKVFLVVGIVAIGARLCDGGRAIHTSKAARGEARGG